MANVTAPANTIQRMPGAKRVTVGESWVERRSDCRHENEREQSDPSIDEHHCRRQCPRACDRGRISNPDDIATDIAGEEVIEKARDEKGGRQPAEPEVEVLRFQQHCPSATCWRTMIPRYNPDATNKEAGDA